MSHVEREREREREKGRERERGEEGVESVGVRHV
jgi:hypothetical protein